MDRDASALASAVESLPFVREFGVRIVEVRPGAVTVEMPFAERFSTPPGLFPASVVGTVGDIAAISSCLTLAPKGHATATLDYTVKMTGQARGVKLIARGKVLQAGQTLSVGSADVFAVDAAGSEKQCGVVIATGRNFEVKP